MVFQKGKFGATYWNEGYLDKDIRTGLNLLGRWPETTVSGRDHMLILFCFGQDVNSPDAARRYAEDYRTPDRLAAIQGQAVIDNPGDYDRDGFNEAEGCYVLSSANSGVAFTLHGRPSPRIHPAFKILQWEAEAPKTILVVRATVDSNRHVFPLRPIAASAERVVLRVARLAAAGSHRARGRKPRSTGRAAHGQNPGNTAA
jgi:hypothetical protein